MPELTIVAHVIVHTDDLVRFILKKDIDWVPWRTLVAIARGWVLIQVMG